MPLRRTFGEPGVPPKAMIRPSSVTAKSLPSAASNRSTWPSTGSDQAILRLVSGLRNLDGRNRGRPGRVKAIPRRDQIAAAVDRHAPDRLSCPGQGLRRRASRDRPSPYKGPLCQDRLIAGEFRLLAGRQVKSADAAQPRVYEHFRLAGQHQRPAVPLAAGIEMEVLAVRPIAGRRPPAPTGRPAPRADSR